MRLLSSRPGGPGVSVYNIVGLLLEAYKTAYTPRNCRAAFASVGFCPLDLCKVLHRAQYILKPRKRKEVRPEDELKQYFTEEELQELLGPLIVVRSLRLLVFFVSAGCWFALYFIRCSKLATLQLSRPFSPDNRAALGFVQNEENDANEAAADQMAAELGLDKEPPRPQDAKCEERQRQLMAEGPVNRPAVDDPRLPPACLRVAKVGPHRIVLDSNLR